MGNYQTKYEGGCQMSSSIISGIYVYLRPRCLLSDHLWPADTSKYMDLKFIKLKHNISSSEIYGKQPVNI